MINILNKEIYYMSQEFQPGDVVQMKSGGPQMTVELISEDKVHCSWFDKNTLCEKDFNKEILKKYKPNVGVRLMR